MTPKIALIIGIAATALAFGVPTGLAERQHDSSATAAFYAQQSDSPAQQNDSSATAAFYAQQSDSPAQRNDSSATAAFYAQQSDSPAQRNDSSATAAFYANERATLVGQGSGSVVSDHVRLDSNEASPTVSVSSGSEIEWSQLGIGFGLGILLIAGLWLAMRMTKGRPLAH